MHWTARLGAAAILAALPAAPSLAQQPTNQQRVAEIDARLVAGTANPATDAQAAARRGEFGLIVTGDGARGGRSAPGVICFTPYFQEPSTTLGYPHSDAITPEVERWLGYASAYNRTIVDHAGYPDADLCRPVVRGEDRPQGHWPIDKPARVVNRPIGSLHEAARRGSAADIRRMLRSASVNTFDGVGMTPLAWAVARNNDAAIDALVAAGANPWLSNNGWNQNALFWAAAFGRQAEFERLANLPGRTQREWPAIYLNAALHGGSKPIIQHILAEPHAKYRIDMQPSPLPAPELLDLVKHEMSARDLMREGLELQGRPDLVHLALTNGADPNAASLASVAKGIYPSSLEIVDMLLAAGANPNGDARERPIWQSIRMLKLDDKPTEVDQRATTIIDKLIVAGADINLPNEQRVPTAWEIFFPRSFDRTEYDPSFVTPALLELLVSKGLDLNVSWQDRPLLAAVEEKGGADSELATTLRRLGARK